MGSQAARSPRDNSPPQHHKAFSHDCCFCSHPTTSNHLDVLLSHHHRRHSTSTSALLYTTTSVQTHQHSRHPIGFRPLSIPSTSQTAPSVQQPCLTRAPRKPITARAASRPTRDLVARGARSSAITSATPPTHSLTQ
jgi:hypothetical protein